MNRITAEDVHLSKHILDFVNLQPAPMCVIDIVENRDMTIAVFILKHGATLPMHDHPGMHGFLKVISGTVEISSYTLKTKDDHIVRLNEEVRAVKHRPISLDDTSPACALTPREKNLHEILCVEGPAAFLDILSPPYEVEEYAKGPRPCTFFKIISSKSSAQSADIVEDVKLLVLENPPEFYSTRIEYSGPPLAL